MANRLDAMGDPHKYRNLNKHFQWLLALPARAIGDVDRLVQGHDPFL